MILAKFYQKFLPKCKVLISRTQRTVLILLIASSKFVPKSIHQIARFQLQKYKLYQLLTGGTSPQTPPFARKHVIGADQITPPMLKTDLRPWAGAANMMIPLFPVCW